MAEAEGYGQVSELDRCEVPLLFSARARFARGSASGSMGGVWGGCSDSKWLFAILRMSSVSTKGGTIFLKKLGKAQTYHVFEKILSPKGILL